MTSTEGEVDELDNISGMFMIMIRIGEVTLSYLLTEQSHFGGVQL